MMRNIIHVGRTGMGIPSSEKSVHSAHSVFCIGAQHTGHRGKSTRYRDDSGLCWPRNGLYRNKVVRMGDVIRSGQILDTF